MTETTATADHPSNPLFVRPTEGRMFAGVCAGVAKRWNLDVTLVRIVAVVLTLLSGVGLVAYVAAWLLTPSADGPAPRRRSSPPLPPLAACPRRRMPRRRPRPTVTGPAGSAAAATA